MLIICGWKRTCCADGRCYHVQSNVAGAGFVEKVWWFFLLPLQFALSSPRCNKNNMVVSQTKHSHREAGSVWSLLTPASPAQTPRSRCRFEKDPNLIYCQICTAVKLICYLVLTRTETTEMKISLHPLPVSVESIKTQSQTLSLTLDWFIRSGLAVNHAVNVRALKSTITEDLDWII